MFGSRPAFDTVAGGNVPVPFSDTMRKASFTAHKLNETDLKKLAQLHRLIENALFSKLLKIILEKS